MMKKCPKCGNEADSNFCTECGCTMEEMPLKNNHMYDSNGNVKVIGYIQERGEVIDKYNNIEKPKKKHNKKLIIILSIVIAVLVLAGIIAGVSVSKAIEEKDYIKNLNAFGTLVIQGLADAETQCNLVQSVWHDAIWDDPDSETRKYVQGAEDFNEALQNLYSDEDISEDINALNNNKGTVKLAIDSLKNPPEGYEKYYDTALDLYAKYESFLDMAIEPSGSYNAYTENFRNLDNETLELFKKFQSMIPSVEGD